MRKRIDKHSRLKHVANDTNGLELSNTEKGYAVVNMFRAKAQQAAKLHAISTKYSHLTDRTNY